MLYKTTFCILASLMILTVSAMADSGLRFWAQGVAGYNTYELADLNDELNEVGLDEISGGLVIGGGVGVALPSGWRIGAGLQHFAANSERSENGVTLEYDVPAMAFFGTVEFTRQTGARHTVGLAGSVGAVQLDGTLRLAVAGYGASEGKAKGDGMFAEIRLLNEYAVTEWLSIAPSFGYRLAKVGEVKINDEVLVKSDGENYEMDYSGLTVQAGIRVFFGGSTSGAAE